MKNHFKYPILLFLLFISCNDQENKIENKEPLYHENKNIKYGFDFNKFFVNEKKIIPDIDFSENIIKTLSKKL